MFESIPVFRDIPGLRNIDYTLEPTTLELAGGGFIGLVGAEFLSTFLTRIFKLSGNISTVASVAIKLVGAGTAMGYGIKHNSALGRGVGLGFMISLLVNVSKRFGLSMAEAGMLGSNFATGLGGPADETLDLSNYQYPTEEYNFPEDVELAGEPEQEDEEEMEVN